MTRRFYSISCSRRLHLEFASNSRRHLPDCKWISLWVHTIFTSMSGRRHFGVHFHFIRCVRIHIKISPISPRFHFAVTPMSPWFHFLLTMNLLWIDLDASKIAWIWLGVGWDCCRLLPWETMCFQSPKRPCGTFAGLGCETYEKGSKIHHQGSKSTIRVAKYTIRVSKYTIRVSKYTICLRKIVFSVTPYLFQKSGY